MQRSIFCNEVSKHFGYRFVGWGGIPLKPKSFRLGSRHHRCMVARPMTCGLNPVGDSVVGLALRLPTDYLPVVAYRQ
jgi:hypothetical protein